MHLSSDEQALVDRVKNGDREIFLPAAEEVVSHIDLENGKMIVSILEGLLDLNEV